MTAFLIIVGLTGSVLGFYTELDRWLCPALYPVVQAERSRLTMAELADRAQAQAPESQVTMVYLHDSERAEVRVQPRPNAADLVSVLSYDTLILDPYTGQELARRKWGDISQGRINLMSFIYELHYGLVLGRFGIWLLGIVALVWTLDCLNSIYLTLPSGLGSKPFLTRWAPAWRIKRGASRTRLNFDLHRAGGLWLWPILLMFAWSSVYMNLWDTVYTWTTRAVLDYHPYWSELENAPVRKAGISLDWHAAEAQAEALLAKQAAVHGFSVERPVALGFDSGKNLYSYRVRSNLDVQDRLGVTRVFFDATTGELRHLELPTGQYTGNTVSSWLFALHMANVFGLPWRIFVCVLGLLIVGLCVTGVLIWLRKARKRKITARLRVQAEDFC